MTCRRHALLSAARDARDTASDTDNSLVSISARVMSQLPRIAEARIRALLLKYAGALTGLALFFFFFEEEEEAFCSWWWS